VKTILTYAALVCFTAVSVVSVVHAVRTEVRREPPFDATSLGAWLATPSHEDESPVVLRRAARQLEQEFHDKSNRRAEYQALDKAKRQAFEANWKRLVVTLIRRHAEAYAATPERDQKAFLNQRLAQFAGWYVYDDGVKVPAATALRNLKSSSGPGLQLDPGELDRINKLADALQKAAVDRIKDGLFPGGGPDRGERDDR
jgi:hypothetical protein